LAFKLKKPHKNLKSAFKSKRAAKDEISSFAATQLLLEKIF